MAARVTSSKCRASPSSTSSASQPKKISVAIAVPRPSNSDRLRNSNQRFSFVGSLDTILSVNHFVANLPRRSFLKTIGGAAVATALPHVILGAQSQKRSVAVLWEPEFRQFNGCDISRETLRQALESFTVEFLGERDLIAQLDAARFDLLVTPYGSAFP